MSRPTIKIELDDAEEQLEALRKEINDLYTTLMWSMEIDFEGFKAKILSMRELNKEVEKKQDAWNEYVEREKLRQLKIKYE